MCPTFEKINTTRIWLTVTDLALACSRCGFDRCDKRMVDYPWEGELMDISILNCLIGLQLQKSKQNMES
uniref:Uncharacterized protein n=1 Tax=Arundo donax TaxID=35708 RepID=A0A0A9GRM5_ARUDO